MNFNLVTIGSLSIRHIEEDGKHLYCLKDVCDNLNIKNSRDASIGIEEYCYGRIIKVNNILRCLTFIDEKGLLELIMRSRKPKAMALKKEMIQKFIQLVNNKQPVVLENNNVVERLNKIEGQITALTEAITSQKFITAVEAIDYKKPEIMVIHKKNNEFNWTLRVVELEDGMYFNVYDISHIVGYRTGMYNKAIRKCKLEKMPIEYVRRFEYKDLGYDIPTTCVSYLQYIHYNLTAAILKSSIKENSSKLLKWINGFMNHDDEPVFVNTIDDVNTIDNEKANNCDYKDLKMYEDNISSWRKYTNLFVKEIAIKRNMKTSMVYAGLYNKLEFKFNVDLKEEVQKEQDRLIATGQYNLRDVKEKVNKLHVICNNNDYRNFLTEAIKGIIIDVRNAA